MRAFLKILALGGLLAGCAALKPQPPDPGLFLLAPGLAGVELSLNQSITFSKGASRFEALAALEVGPQHLALAALGPMGNRMLALSWDGRKLEQQADPSLPKDLPLRLILRDVQLAYWPAQALRDAFKGRGWTLQESADQRILLEDGREIVRISYGGADRWHSRVTFEHLGLGYRLDIKPINDDGE